MARKYVEFDKTETKRRALRTENACSMQMQSSPGRLTSIQHSEESREFTKATRISKLHPPALLKVPPHALIYFLFFFFILRAQAVKNGDKPSRRDIIGLSTSDEFGTVLPSSS